MTLRRKGDEGSVTWWGSNMASLWRGLRARWTMMPGVEQYGGGGQQAVANEAGGDPITADIAQTLSAVWRCTRLISETIAGLPLGVYQKQEDGARRLRDDLDISTILTQRPNDDQTAFNFLECIIAQAVLNGNGFGRKLMVEDRLVGVELLTAPRVSWRLVGRSYEFRFTRLDGTTITIPESQIFHIPGVSMHGKFGMSTIEYGSRVFGGALAANQTALRTFRNGLHSSHFFKIDRVLTKAQRDEFEKNTKARISGALNAGNAPLLEGGMDVGNFALAPDVMQLLQSRAFSVEEVCRWFGVPPSMIGAGDKASSWASSSESLNLWFLQYTLTPWLRRVEQAIRRDLFSDSERRRMYPEFQVEGLLRANTAGRSQLYASALQNGWMSRNEVRKLENLPPMDGGDQFTVQSNLVPIDQLGDEAGTPAAALEDSMKRFLGLVEKANEGASDVTVH